MRFRKMLQGKMRPALMLLCVGLMVLAGYEISKTLIEENNSKTLNEDIQEKAVETVPIPSLEGVDASDERPKEQEEQLPKAPITVDFDVLHEENEDIIAWLYCPDTPINYPVVQSNDNDYYLRRLLDGSYNTAGTLFADYRCASDFTGWISLIYGHNMKNDTMFGTLPDYREQDYFEEHPVMYLLTPTQNYMVELFAGYVTSTTDSIYEAIDTQEERNNILQRSQSQSNFTTDIEVTDDDRLLILSTCSYEYENARYVVLGKLTEIQ